MTFIHVHLRSYCFKFITFQNNVRGREWIKTNTQGYRYSFQVLINDRNYEIYTQKVI